MEVSTRGHSPLFVCWVALGEATERGKLVFRWGFDERVDALTSVLTHNRSAREVLYNSRLLSLSLLHIWVSTFAA